jgi:beta-xylosidase
LFIRFIKAVKDSSGVDHHRDEDRGDGMSAWVFFNSPTINRILKDLKEILDLVISIEKAEWTEIKLKMIELKLSKRELMENYHHSCKWTEELLSQEVTEMT